MYAKQQDKSNRDLLMDAMRRACPVVREDGGKFRQLIDTIARKESNLNLKADARETR